MAKHMAAATRTQVSVRLENMANFALTVCSLITFLIVLYLKSVNHDHFHAFCMPGRVLVVRWGPVQGRT
jgi:hypothetical protein